MAKLTVRITHVAWREGRPRFVPGPKLRALGFKGQDLRSPSGAWMTAAQAAAWVTAQEAAIAARRAAVAKARAGKRAIPALRERSAELSVEGLFELFWRAPAMRGETLEEGKRRQKPRAARTVADYKAKARVLEQFDPDIWTGPVARLDKPAAYDLYERLWAAKGLATARGVVAVLRLAVSWALKRGHLRLPNNALFDLGMEMPQPRVRALTPAEVRHLVATADRLGRPEIGDAIALGVWTGQRQGDRLALLDAGLADGRRRFRQGKTGAIVEIRQAPELEARLDAARARRAGRIAHLAGPVEVLLDEKRWRPWAGSHYSHTFAAVRTAAAETMASVADARDQDLRDTAVTWLARAGCTVPEIAQITGHTQASVHGVLKHYLASHPEVADNAIKKLVAWYDGQGDES